MIPGSIKCLNFWIYPPPSPNTANWFRVCATLMAGEEWSSLMLILLSTPPTSLKPLKVCTVLECVCLLKNVRCLVNKTILIMCFNVHLRADKGDNARFYPGEDHLKTRVFGTFLVFGLDELAVSSPGVVIFRGKELCLCRAYSHFLPILPYPHRFSL